MRFRKVISRPLNSLYFIWDQYRRPNDYLLATMQSSGTHWVRFMIAKSLVDYYALDYEFQSIHPVNIIPGFGLDAHEVYQYNEFFIVPRVQHTHQFFQFPHRIFFQQKRVILLVRDLRDALLSHYNKIRRGRSNITFESFIRNDEMMRRWSVHGSLGGRVDFLNSWGDALPRLDALIVHFESLKRAPHTELKRILRFMDIEASDEFVDTVVDFSSSANMRKIGQRAFAEGTTHKPNQEVRAVSGRSINKKEEWFDGDVEQYFRDYVNRHLKYDFGYQY